MSGKGSVLGWGLVLIVASWGFAGGSGPVSREPDVATDSHFPIPCGAITCQVVGLVDSRCDTHTCAKVRLDDGSNANNTIDTEPSSGPATAPLYWGNRQVFLQGTDLNAASGTFSGNVGIGTTGPGAKLHVVGPNGGSGTVTSIIARSQPAATTDEVSLIAGVDGSNDMNVISYGNAIAGTRFGVNKADTGGFIGDGIAGGLLIGSINAAAPIIFGVNDAEKVRIDTAGNVGIGTTSPRRALDVDGPIRTSRGVQFPDVIAIADGETLRLCPFAEGFFLAYRSGNPPGGYAFGIRAGGGETVLIAAGGTQFGFSAVRDTPGKINLFDGGAANAFCLMAQNLAGTTFNLRLLWLGDVQ